MRFGLSRPPAKWGEVGRGGLLLLVVLIASLPARADDDKLPPNAPSYDHDLLQVMPWPVFSKMTDRDLRAIYEYLSAIPCLEGSPDPKSPLHNDCH